MNLNKSIVKNAALTWFGQLGFEPHMAHGGATQTWDDVFSGYLPEFVRVESR